MARATVRQGNVRNLAGRGRRRRRGAHKFRRRRGLRARRVPTRAIKAIVNKTLSRRSENKVYINSTTQVDMAGTWYSANLSDIVQGDNSQTRDGASVFAKSLSLNMFAYLDANTSHDFFRWLIVDAPEGDPLNITDILQDTSPVSSAMVSRYRRVDNPAVLGDAKKYRVLASGEEYLNQTTKQTDFNRIRIKLNQKMLWDNSDTDGSHHIKHDYRLWIINAHGAVNPTIIKWNSRLHYKDE